MSQRLLRVPKLASSRALHRIASLCFLLLTLARLAYRQSKFFLHLTLLCLSFSTNGKPSATMDNPILISTIISKQKSHLA